eukprot:scaffold38562_cov27-Tisochrysis_lutea.AAC.3
MAIGANEGSTFLPKTSAEIKGRGFVSSDPSSKTSYDAKDCGVGSPGRGGDRLNSCRSVEGAWRSVHSPEPSLRAAPTEPWAGGDTAVSADRLKLPSAKAKVSETGGVPGKSGCLKVLMAAACDEESFPPNAWYCFSRVEESWGELGRPPPIASRSCRVPGAGRREAGGWET